MMEIVWVILGLSAYVAYVIAYAANHPGGEVRGVRALTLFPFVVPLMVFWWVIGRARVYKRNDGHRGLSIGIEKND